MRDDVLFLLSGSRRLRPLVVLAVVVSTVGPVLPGTRPLTVSPGDPERALLTENSCPFFSWAPATEPLIDAQRLSVLPSDSKTDEPALDVTLPPTANSWSPSGPGCLEPGRGYRWRVIALAGGAEVARSPWAGFAIAEPTSTAPSRTTPERSQARESTSRALSVGRIDNESRSRRSRDTVSPSLASEFSIDDNGNLMAGQLSGSGSGLTDVTAVDLDCVDCVGTADVDTTVLQRRIGSACSSIATMTVIGEDGNATCEADNAVSLPDEAFFEASVVDGGTATTNVASTLNYEACFLTLVEFGDLGGGDETTACTIRRLEGATEWQLEAFAGGDAETACAMRCLRN